MSSPLSTGTPPSSRAPIPRGTVSRSQIAEGALALVEREGLEALTMRRLAYEVGVGTMTLYGHFRDKEELLDAIVDIAAERFEIPPAGGPWRSQLHSLMDQIWRALAEHPFGVYLRQRRPMWSRGALRVSEAGIRALREAGFSKADAAHGYRSLFNYTFGFSAFSPAEVLPAHKEAALAALAALPEDEYPVQIDVASELVDGIGGEAQFHYGLDLLLDGLELKLNRRASP